jgi:glycosyltransferase involved in cell wall biosynthesis
MSRQWDHKPRVLIVTDSPYLDTGFARVGREIGLGLNATGRYEVVSIGWYHRQTSRLIPYRVIPTQGCGKQNMTIQEKQEALGDQFAQQTFVHWAPRLKPDLVIVIGDEWMVRDVVSNSVGMPWKTVAYVPVDGVPINSGWLPTFAKADQLVLFCPFAEETVRATERGARPDQPPMPIHLIPHGVDTEVFYPLSAAVRSAAREMAMPGGDGKFIVGTVSRNNKRKMLPRLLKAFAQFVRDWTACRECGVVTMGVHAQCQLCGGTVLATGPGKVDPILYLHMQPNDPAGHDIFELVKRFGLQQYVSFPAGLEIGHGIPDSELNKVYNAMDLFTLPTGGEGWGLPILEAMAAAVPVMVSDYSSHPDFVRGAGDLLPVAELYTSTSGVERALVDVIEYACHLDRTYYEDLGEFLNKWGVYLQRRGLETTDWLVGEAYRKYLGALGRRRSLDYDWAKVAPQWVTLADRMLDVDPDIDPSNFVTEQPIHVEVC